MIVEYDQENRAEHTTLLKPGRGDDRASSRFRQGDAMKPLRVTGRRSLYMRLGIGGA